ncbi:MAG: 50S ribosomal protein L22 [Actinomycetota bacterium]|nr:50S ribosomal protein L22 [Actinomycetota bacterium]
MPETKATLKYLRTSAYKVREVLGLIRGLDVEDARHVLRYCERGAARDVLKLLDSAVANAENTLNIPADELYVSVAFADEGPTIKRWRPRARGRATRIRKRTSHMTIVVARFSDDELQARRRREAAEPGGRRRGMLPRRRRGGDKAAAPPAKAAAEEKADAVSEVPESPEEASLSEAEPGSPEAAEKEAAAVEAEEPPPAREESAEDPGVRGGPDDTAKGSN